MHAAGAGWTRIAFEPGYFDNREHLPSLLGLSVIPERCRGDDEIGAIAARRGKGLDIMLYRFQPEPDPPDRVVRFSLAGWPGGKMDVTFELIDSKHSNPLHDSNVKHLERAGLWTSIEPTRFSQLDFRLEPLSVARIRIQPR